MQPREQGSPAMPRELCSPAHDAHVTVTEELEVDGHPPPWEKDVAGRISSSRHSFFPWLNRSDRCLSEEP